MIHVFLPAYNEEKALPILAKKFDSEFKKLGESYRIVILDDGSSDKTAEMAVELSRNYPIHLLKHGGNKGLGQTIKDGMRFVSDGASPDDLIVTMDCDDTHDPKFMGAAIKKARAGYDLVVLSRYEKGGGELGLQLHRQILSRCAGLLLKAAFPLKGVRDYSCGYRVFRASAVQHAWKVYGDEFISLTHMGFVAIPEILIKFRMMGARIGEAPFILNYGLKAGKSKINTSKTIQGYFVLISRFAGRKAKVTKDL